MILRNDVVQTMQMTLLLYLRIFSIVHVNLREEKIVERAKRDIVVNIATREQMV